MDYHDKKEAETQKAATHLSTGDGIAILGIWFAAAAVTIIAILATFFVWDVDIDTSNMSESAGVTLALLGLAILFGPAIAAIATTSAILKRSTNPASR